MEFLEQYTIEKGTKLYRRYIDNNIYDEMFFAFCPFGTYGASHSNNPIQIWETQVAIRGNLMLKDVSNKNRLKSSLAEVYNQLINDDSQDSLDIKMCIDKRKLVTDCLRINRITNWITSVEDKREMELFLFSGLVENSQLMNYLGELGPSVGYDSLNSFNYNIIALP